MRRLVQLLLILVVLGVGVGLALTRVAPLQDAVVRAMAKRIFAQTRADLFADGALRAVACGTSSPVPDPARAGACVAVFAGGKFYVVDTGLGAWKNLALWRVPGERIGAVFYTHFHSDHIAELGEFNLQTWGAGRPAPLRVYGGRGVERLVAGFSEAYALDRGYRTAHHGPEVMHPHKGMMEAHPFDVDAATPAGAVILEEHGLVVRAFPVDHAPIEPAIGYRFDYQGRAVVVSGDTVPAPSLVAAARGADVLFHEAQANFLVSIIQEEAAAAGSRQYARILGDIPSYHTSPVDAARIANDAGVGLLVLYHLTPPPLNSLVERIFMRGVSDVRPRGTVVARDGFLVTLPAGSATIDTGRLR
jgi:ribonuclease Z